MIRHTLSVSVAAACLALAAATAHAQLRTIPAEAKRGELRHLQDMIVDISGKAVRLSPGAQIRDTENRIMLPTAVPAGVIVKYTVDAEGMVHRVWLLSPQEAAQPDAKK